MKTSPWFFHLVAKSRKSQNVTSRPFRVLTSPSADRHSGTLNRAHSKSGNGKSKGKGRQAKQSGWQKHLERYLSPRKRANRQGYHLFGNVETSRRASVADPLFLTRFALVTKRSVRRRGLLFYPVWTVRIAVSRSHVSFKCFSE